MAVHIQQRPSLGWEHARGVVLAGVGGYLDTLGFVMLDGLFVNHVTGNIIVAASSPGTRYLAEIIMFPVFFAMVAAGTYVADAVDRRAAHSGIPAALTLEASLLALFMILGLAWFPEPGAGGTTARVVVGCVGVGAMAVQTAVTRLAGHLFPTNMVTGTMTILGMDAARLVSPTGASSEHAVRKRRVSQLASVVFGFIAGAAVAALLTPRLHFGAAALPMIVVGLVARRQLRGEPEPVG